MKRFTLMLAGLFLFVNSPMLSAASQIDFSGYYRVQAYSYSGWWQDQSHSNDGANDLSERMIRNRLRMNIVFRPTDGIELKWRVHGPHNARWGRADADYGLTTRYIYGIVKTDFGKISIGRISTDLDSAGLQTLGYVPYYSFGMQGAIFDTDSEKSGIMFRKDWEKWGVKAFYIKETAIGPGSDNYGSDQDYDRFSIEPYYKWDKGGVSLALQYDRNMGRNQSANATATPPRREAYFDTNYHFTINPALTHTWAIDDKKSLTLNLEGKYAWGERKNGPGTVDAQGNRDTKKRDVDGAGIYADLTYKYGGGNVALSGWWMDGTADGSGRHNLVTTGEGFYPFTVFHSPYAFPKPSGSKDLEGHDQNNHWAAAIMGDHALTPEVSLSYALGSFSKVKTANNVSKHMGTEIDFGLTIQLLDNLQFTTKAGYFITGDYYKEQYNRRDYDKNVLSWGNELIFYF